MQRKANIVLNVFTKTLWIINENTLVTDEPRLGRLHENFVDEAEQHLGRAHVSSVDKKIDLSTGRKIGTFAFSRLRQRSSCCPMASGLNILRQTLPCRLENFPKVSLRIAVIVPHQWVF